MDISISKTISFMLGLGSAISGILALVIICVPIIGPLFIENYVPPKFIENWGGVIIGFYFGSFISQISNFLNQNKILKNNQSHPPPAEPEACDMGTAQSG